MRTISRRYQRRNSLALAGGADATLRSGGDIVKKFGRANEFFGEIRAVLEQIEDLSAQLRIGVQAVQADGIPGKAFEKMLKGLEAAVQLGSRRALSPGAERAAPARARCCCSGRPASVVVVLA